MTLSESTFLNGTEVDLTNFEHETPSLTLIKETLTLNGLEGPVPIHFYTIKNYKTNRVHKHFHTLAEVTNYCNENFDTNFKTL